MAFYCVIGDNSEREPSFVNQKLLILQTIPNPVCSHLCYLGKHITGDGWLDAIADSVDMNVDKLPETVRNEEA